MIPRPVIAAILYVILNILQRWRPTTTCQSELKYNHYWKLSENIYQLQFWFEIEFCLKLAAILFNI